MSAPPPGAAATAYVFLGVSTSRWSTSSTARVGCAPQRVLSSDTKLKIKAPTVRIACGCCSCTLWRKLQRYCISSTAWYEGTLPDGTILSRLTSLRSPLDRASLSPTPLLGLFRAANPVTRDGHCLPCPQLEQLGPLPTVNHRRGLTAQAS